MIDSSLPTRGGDMSLSEAAVRLGLRDELLASVGHPTETVFEFWVPRENTRADVVVVGSCLSGFEIKTHRDTLERLPRQAIAYARIFDHCTVVVAERHLAASIEMLPHWWGVTSIGEDDDRPTFLPVRAATPNPNVDPETLVRLLWRDEARAALRSLGCEPDHRASRSAMWANLVDRVDLEDLKDIVRGALLSRDFNLARIPTRRAADSVSAVELLRHKAEMV